MHQPLYDSPRLKVCCSRRDEIQGEPVERYDIELADGTKNVLLVLRVNTRLASDMIDGAAKWLGDACHQMSGETVKFHGVVLYDNDDFAFDVVEVR